MKRFNKNIPDNLEHINWLNTICSMNVNDSFVFPKGKSTYATKAVTRENERAKNEGYSMFWNVIRTNNGGVIIRTM